MRLVAHSSATENENTFPAQSHREDTVILVFPHGVLHCTHILVDTPDVGFTHHQFLAECPVAWLK